MILSLPSCEGGFLAYVRHLAGTPHIYLFGLGSISCDGRFARGIDVCHMGAWYPWRQKMHWVPWTWSYS